jgi:hypothetical protein
MQPPFLKKIGRLILINHTKKMIPKDGIEKSVIKLYKIFLLLAGKGWPLSNIREVVYIV